MSIETLLEAAKFLELQAQQQQKAREENELKEKLRLEQLAEHRHSSLVYTSPVHHHHQHHHHDQHVHHVAKAEERRVAHRLPPQPLPITVIPVVTASHTCPPFPPPPLPASLSEPAALHFPSPPRRDPYSPPQEGAGAPPPVSPQSRPDPSPSSLASAATASYQPPPSNQNHHHHHPLPPLTVQHAAAQPPPLQRYPGSIVTVPQQQPQQPLLPQPGPPQAPLPTSPNSRGSPPDDGRHLDNKKRPGGAGTRDVHNKLEKNRRAHLKECFEMLKKNIPNVDEKKTSNLSVLRSALRYIQTLKRKEKEFEHEMERLAREKIATQQRLDELKNELGQWMDVMEVDRVLRQTVQPEEDQASTSTASEGEDIDDPDQDGETARRMPTALPAVPRAVPPEQRKTPALTPVPPPPPIAATVATHPLLPQHISIQHKPPVHQTLALPKPTVLAASGIPGTAAIQALLPAQTQVVTSQPCLQPTVIAHAPASHASVIQAVNHVIQASGHKHMAHLAPSGPSGAVQLATGHRHHHQQQQQQHHHHHHHHQQISHITVTPVAHLGPHLPTIYSQSVAVTQLNGGMPGQTAGGAAAAAVVSKQTGAQMVAHHPQLVGQAMLNPVTMVTMPSFPVRL